MHFRRCRGLPPLFAVSPQHEQREVQYLPTLRDAVVLSSVRQELAVCDSCRSGTACAQCRFAKRLNGRPFDSNSTCVSRVLFGLQTDTHTPVLTACPSLTVSVSCAADCHCVVFQRRQATAAMSDGTQAGRALSFALFCGGLVVFSQRLPPLMIRGWWSLCSSVLPSPPGCRDQRGGSAAGLSGGWAWSGWGHTGLKL